MDAGSNIRPLASIAAVSPVRQETAPVQGAVRTDLPATETVSASADTEAARLDLSAAARRVQVAKAKAEAKSQAQQAVDTIERSLAEDRDTREMVFKATDTRTGRVVLQIPDEALLRLRAYVAAQQAHHDAATVEKTA